MASDSNTSNDCAGEHKRSNQGSPGGQLLDRQPRQEREEWLGQWAHIWTKRQSPEWKPRRASVATCQRQYQQTCHNDSHGESMTNYHTLADTSFKKFLSLYSHQRRHLEAHCRSPLSTSTIKVNNNTNSSSGSSNKSRSNINKHDDYHDHDEKRSGLSTKTASQLPLQDNSRHEPSSNESSTKTQSEEVPNREASERGGNKWSQDLTLCSNITTADITDKHRRLSNDEIRRSGQFNLNRSPIRAIDLAQQLTAVTCCSDLSASQTPSELSVNSVGFGTDDDALATTVAINQELQLQDKQRKFLIISMALEKMKLEGSFVNECCCRCSSNNNNNKSCSTNFKRSTQTKINTGATKQKKQIDDSRMVLNNPRSKHIDRLSSVSAVAQPRFSCCRKSNSQKRHKTKTNTTDLKNIQFEEDSSLKDCCQKDPESSSEEEIMSSCDDGDGSLIPENEHHLSNLCANYYRSNNSFYLEPKSDAEKETDTEQQDVSNKITKDRQDHESSTRANTSLAASAYNKGSSLENDSEDLESLIIESWLDDHPSFVHDYFMRKTSRQLIDDWLITHAKVSNTTQVSSQLDLTVNHQILSRPLSKHSLNSHLHASGIKLYDNDLPKVHAGLFEQQQQHNINNRAATVANMASSFNRSTRSNSQSGCVTPVRKISATDFESRTGNAFLRPMVSTTPDGRPTFLSQSNRNSEGDDCNQRGKQRGENKTSFSENANLNVNKSMYEGTEDREEEEEEVRKREEREEQIFEKIIDSCDTKERDERELAKDGEVRLIFELVKNICNDLDIRTLLHKILKNVAVLINADKSLLFLVCGQPGDPTRHLVSQLFNVDQDSEVSEPNGDCITIPWSTGLVGYVAESGESVNIENCYDDPRFTSTIDQRTGYVTRHMLCAPIYDKRNEIVGVAQVLNKRDGNPFSKSDEIKFKRYLQFCGIGLRNAQSYEHCQLENRRNQVLLDLARMVFEEQSTIEQVVYRIMLHTQSLLACQRCQVLLIDDGSDDLDQLLQLPNSTFNFYQKQRKQTIGRKACQTAVDGAEHGTPKPEWRPQCNNAGSDCQEMSIHPTKAEGQDQKQDKDQSQGDNEGIQMMDELIFKEMVQQQQQHHHQHHYLQQQQALKLFSLVFDLECDGNDLVMHSNKDQKLAADDDKHRKCSTTSTTRRFPINIGITGYVAMTGETLNIEDAHQNDRFDPSVDEGSNFKHKSILCMPIRNGQRQIIGVSQLINKKNGKPFNKNDEDLFEAFAIFCGLGIHNTLMYEKVLKIMAKQRVTFEILSYHATAPLEEAKKLYLEKIPSCFSLNLTSLKFNDFSLDEQYMLKSCLRFFLDLDLIRRFQIDQLVFCNWILSVQKNYRKVTYHPIVGGNGLKASPVRYHNWRHAFNVSQMMFAILIICQALGELETLALLIACLCHDLDHRGTNNSFQIKSASPLAELYSTSTMEHHHFDQCVMILNSQGNQILANLSPEEYSRVIVLLEEAILATDLANYFQRRELFFQLVNCNQFEWHNNKEHRSLLRCMLMTACDVAAITKPWPIQKVVADLVMSEFYHQGDIEKHELNIEPIDMMNRDKMSKLPEMQIGFIDSICAPIYSAFAKLFPHILSPLLEGCLSNRNLWTEMATNNDIKSDLPLARYLNNNKTNNNNNDQAPTIITKLPKINTSLPEVGIYQFGESEQEPNVQDQSFNALLPSISTCEHHLLKVDCQRKSV